MAKKLPIGCGLHRARNRSRPGRYSRDLTASNQVVTTSRPLVLRKTTVKRGGAR